MASLDPADPIKVSPSRLLALKFFGAPKQSVAFQQSKLNWLP